MSSCFLSFPLRHTHLLTCSMTPHVPLVFLGAALSVHFHQNACSLSSCALCLPGVALHQVRSYSLGNAVVDGVVCFLSVVAHVLVQLSSILGSLNTWALYCQLKPFLLDAF